MSVSASVSHQLRVPALPVSRHFLFALALLLLAPSIALAGGPKYVAGVSYFNPGVLGQPLHWSGGQVNYYVDQGPLNSSVSNQQATAMVDAAAALWSSVPTAAVTLTDKGPLNEDVSGGSLLASGTHFTVANEQISQLAQIAQPADVTPAATNYPLGVLYDADGSVINALFGPGASDPTSCQNNGVFAWIDNVNPDATIAHAIILLNGLCATNSNLLQMMSYELERAFGRILNLDYAQVNPGALQNGETGGTLGWPVMQPLSGVCGPSGGLCIPNPSVLRYDDIAALNRIYPITAQNLASFPGKQLTAANTVSIQGTVAFRTGIGMQGVNVVARPLDANGNPLYQYTVSSVSGAYFNGNHGNPITGFDDANGNLLTQWGSSDTTQQGFFDLSAMPLPPGVTTASYQVTFEAINPLYILTDSVGPYLDGQVTPSGTLESIAVPSLAAGSAKTLTLTVADSAAGGSQGVIGAAASPATLPASGMWSGRLGQVGQSDWFSFPVRGSRTFTIVTQALNESGVPTETKAMSAIGIWDAFDAVGAKPIGAGPGINGLATGETWLRVTSRGDDVVRIGIADQRGDGRPDYAYNGWVLYAGSVSPQRLPASGGAIVIHGMGFRLADTVLVGGQAALVTSISPNEITAIAPPAAAGVSGSVDVEVDDLPTFYAAAIVSGGISYDSGSGDSLTLLTAPQNTVPTATPIPFTVTALGSDLTPAGGVTVIYTVTSGTATLSCGLTVCSVVATGDGRATMNVTATDATWSIVTASLTNGAKLQAQFVGGTPASLTSLTSQLSLAAGATFTWTVQALVLSKGAPLAGQSVAWQTSGSGIVSQGSTAAITTASGIATKSLIVGPLAEGQAATINACLNGTSQCVAFTAIGARPEYALLQPVSGVTQSLSLSATPAPIVLRVYDMNGNPMAGGSVALSQALYAWTPPCAAHTVCAPGNLLATQTAAATSALDGSVAFTPAAIPGVATKLVALAATGNSATLNIAIEQHQ
ncbi:MAG: IPT/TIG domain-containing protein [Terracidiphilus sp.]|nr:IPT/TIG domain-containing protein [Terracidiphilus sp.]